MPELILTDVDGVVFHELQARATRHGRTLPEEAKAILSAVLRGERGDLWAPVDAIYERLAASGRTFGDSADLAARGSRSLNVIVVDASVGVKWFVPEVHAGEARQWRNGPDELHVPTFFFDLEIANILCKKIRRAELSRADADLILGQLPALPLTRHSETPLLVPAFDLADRTQRTVYDCLYLALAVQLAGRMVTADQRLYNSLARTPWAGFVVWVGDLPRGP